MTIYRLLRQRRQALLMFSGLTSVVSLWITLVLVFNSREDTNYVSLFGNTPGLFGGTNFYGKQRKTLNQLPVKWTTLRYVFAHSSKHQALDPYFIPRDHKVNPYNYSFLIDGRTICQGEAPYLLIIVPSVFDHKRERQTVRQTWGNVVKTRKWANGRKLPLVRILFLFAMTYNSEIPAELKEESMEYEDVVVADFVESYRNLTIKSMSALHWTSRFCSGAKYLLKNDEDTIVNLPVLIEVLKENLTNTIIGREGHQLRVIRNGDIPRWNIPREEYPLDYYPPYVLGNYYIIPNHLIATLSHVSQFLPFLSMEDVFMTGVVRLAARAELRNADSCFLVCDFNVVKLAYAVDNSRIRDGWRELAKHQKYI